MPSVTDLTSTNEDVVDVVRSLRVEVAQLKQALTSRIAIEQAKGILAERWQMHVDESFDVLRRAARHHRMNLHELAQQVVESPLTPIQLEAALVSHRHGRLH